MFTYSIHFLFSCDQLSLNLNLTVVNSETNDVLLKPLPLMKPIMKPLPPM